MPAELRMCRAYLSFSLSAVKTESNRRLPSQRGADGLPEAREKRPSPVRTASASPNRIHALNSATNAASAICAVLPQTT